MVMNPARLAAIADALEAVAADIREAIEESAAQVSQGTAMHWRELLWTCPAETRMSVRDVAEAMDCSRSWVTSRLNPPDGSRRIPIPHRKVEGLTVFLAGEVRTWMTQIETVVQMGAAETMIERGALRLRRGA